MKILFFLILIFASGCSFDKNSGIWINENEALEQDKLFIEFKTLSLANNSFNEIINVKQEDFKINVPKKITSTNWKDIFYDETNNLKNFQYDDTQKTILRSKKLTKNKIDKYILSEENNIIFSDQKGNLFVYSLNEKKLKNKFNFYKKRFKNFKKKLNLIVDNGVIYVSDNIGYLYAYNYNSNKILWAKNYKVPYRSNIKISGEKLIASNQNNNLFFYNKNTGEILKLIPTEENTVKNRFINNISLNAKYTFFLNTYGSLYAISNDDMQVKWFINLNQSLDINPSNLFSGNQIINDQKRVYVSSDEFTYVIDADNGSIIFKKNFSSLVKPLLINNHLLLISKNNLLIMTDIDDGKIIYSLDINQEISEFVKSKKKKVQFKNIMFINNKVFVFLKNSFVLRFNLNGKLEEISKFSKKINTFPIVLNRSILYFDYKNKLYVVN